MKIKWDKKYTTISAYTKITFSICFAIVIVISKFDIISSGVNACIKALSAIIWGFAIAYLLNPIMMFCERNLKPLIEKKKPHPKLLRSISTAISIIFGALVILAIIALIVPQLIDSIMTIINSVPTYIENIQSWVNDANNKISEYPEIVNAINSYSSSLESTVANIASNIVPKMSDWAIKLKDGAVSIITTLKDFIIGFIVSVYFLLDKEKFINGAKRLTLAFFPKKAANEILRIADKTNKSLSGFISGKILDSFIMGILFFIIMSIFNMEYAVLISTIVGITNIIPFFGPFIGAIPSAILLLVAHPSQVIPFIILVIVMQQFDGNILGPHILGDTTGLPSFWILFSILLGSGLFGFAGMVLGVPVFAVIYSIIDELSEKALAKKGITNLEEKEQEAREQETKTS